MAVNWLLLFSLGLVIYFDIRYSKVYNIIVYPIIIIGLILNFLSFGIIGIFYSMIGFLIGFCICFIPYNYKICRTGEFKLLGLIGILKGWAFAAAVGLLSSLFTIIFHLVSLSFKGSSKSSLELIMQYGVDISTIIEENTKKIIIPYSLTVSFFSIILIFLKI